MAPFKAMQQAIQAQGLPIPPVLDKKLADLGTRLGKVNEELDTELKKIDDKLKQLSVTKPREIFEKLLTPDYRQLLEVRGGRDLGVLRAVAREQGISLEDLQRQLTGRQGGYRLIRDYRGGLVENLNTVIGGGENELGALARLGGEAAVLAPVGGYLGYRAGRAALGRLPLFGARPGFIGRGKFLGATAAMGALALTNVPGRYGAEWIKWIQHIEVKEPPIQRMVAE